MAKYVTSEVDTSQPDDTTTQNTTVVDDGGEGAISVTAPPAGEEGLYPEDGDNPGVDNQHEPKVSISPEQIIDIRDGFAAEFGNWLSDVGVPWGKAVAVYVIDAIVTFLFLTGKVFKFLPWWARAVITVMYYYNLTGGNVVTRAYLESEVEKGNLEAEDIKWVLALSEAIAEWNPRTLLHLIAREIFKSPQEFLLNLYTFGTFKEAGELGTAVARFLAGSPQLTHELGKAPYPPEWTSPKDVPDGTRFDSKFGVLTVTVSKGGHRELKGTGFIDDYDLRFDKGDKYWYFRGVDAEQRKLNFLALPGDPIPGQASNLDDDIYQAGDTDNPTKLWVHPETGEVKHGDYPGEPYTASANRGMYVNEGGMTHVTNPMASLRRTSRTLNYFNTGNVAAIGDSIRRRGTPAPVADTTAGPVTPQLPGVFYQQENDGQAQEERIARMNANLGRVPLELYDLTQHTPTKTGIGSLDTIGAYNIQNQKNQRDEHPDAVTISLNGQPVTIHPNGLGGWVVSGTTGNYSSSAIIKAAQKQGLIPKYPSTYEGSILQKGANFIQSGAETLGGNWLSDFFNPGPQPGDLGGPSGYAGAHGQIYGTAEEAAASLDEADRIQHNIEVVESEGGRVDSSGQVYYGDDHDWSKPTRTNVVSPGRAEFSEQEQIARDTVADYEDSEGDDYSWDFNRGGYIRKGFNEGGFMHRYYSDGGTADMTVGEYRKSLKHMDSSDVMQLAQNAGIPLVYRNGNQKKRSQVEYELGIKLLNERNNPKAILEWLPVVGDIIAAQDTLDAIKARNWALAAILGGALVIGLIPGVGDAVAMGIKKTAKAMMKVPAVGRTVIASVLKRTGSKDVPESFVTFVTNQANQRPDISAAQLQKMADDFWDDNIANGGPNGNIVAGNGQPYHKAGRPAPNTGGGVEHHSGAVRLPTIRNARDYGTWFHEFGHILGIGGRPGGGAVRDLVLQEELVAGDFAIKAAKAHGLPQGQFIEVLNGQLNNINNYMEMFAQPYTLRKTNPSMWQSYRHLMEGQQPFTLDNVRAFMKHHLPNEDIDGWVDGIIRMRKADLDKYKASGDSFPDLDAVIKPNYGNPKTI